MRGIALWQPWASLVACGLKCVETRSKPAPEWLVGQRIVIHATKGVQPGGERAFRATCDQPRFRWALNQMAVTPAGLPRGALVCTALLARCDQITDDFAYGIEERNPVEFDFGWYEEGRWAWTLEDVQKLREPVPFDGYQGLMNVPREVVWPQLGQGTLL
jgi:hypothetical protein